MNVLCFPELFLYPHFYLFLFLKKRIEPHFYFFNPQVTINTKRPSPGLALLPFKILVHSIEDFPEISRKIKTSVHEPCQNSPTTACLGNPASEISGIVIFYHNQSDVCFLKTEGNR